MVGSSVVLTAISRAPILLQVGWAHVGLLRVYAHVDRTAETAAAEVFARIMPEAA